jgi:hypothetical protein
MKHIIFSGILVKFMSLDHKINFNIYIFFNYISIIIIKIKYIENKFYDTHYFSFKWKLILLSIFFFDNYNYGVIYVIINWNRINFWKITRKKSIFK